jgi:hypothetical protein
MDKQIGLKYEYQCLSAVYVNNISILIYSPIKY